MNDYKFIVRSFVLQIGEFSYNNIPGNKARPNWLLFAGVKQSPKLWLLSPSAANRTSIIIIITTRHASGNNSIALARLRRWTFIAFSPLRPAQTQFAHTLNLWCIAQRVAMRPTQTGHIIYISLAQVRWLCWPFQLADGASSQQTTCLIGARMGRFCLGFANVACAPFWPLNST